MGLTHKIPIDYWAIWPVWGFQAITELERIDASDVKAFFFDEPAAEFSYSVDKGVATFCIDGPLTKEPYCGGMFGGTSTVQLRRALSKAYYQDDAVKDLLLKFKTPGGQVQGTFEAATLVKDLVADGRKRVVGYIDDLCCSAGTWIASQCSELYCNAAATGGSIGTYMVMRDVSEEYKQMGVKVYVIGSGEYKGAGTPGTEVTKKQRDMWQRNVDALNALFKAGVQEGRHMDADRVDELATGETWIGAQLVEQGLADGVCSLDEVYSALYSSQGQMPVNGNNPVRRKGTRMADDKFSLVARIMQTMAGSSDEEDETPQRKPLLQIGRGGSGDQDADTKAMVKTLAKIGVTTEAEANDLIQMASLGATYLTEARRYARKQAVRLYGAERGEKISAQVMHAGIDDVQAVAEAWEAEADAKYGIGKDGTSSGRQSAGGTIPYAENAEGNDGTNGMNLEKLMAQTPLGQAALKRKAGGK